MRLRSIACGLLALPLLATAQQKDAAWTVPAIAAKLAAHGMRMRVDGPVRQPYLAVPGRVLVGSDGTEIQTYVYADAAQREKDTATLEATTAAPATARVHWLMPVSLVTNANAAMIVLSRDPAMHQRIRASFGAPATGAAADPEKVLQAFHAALQKRDLEGIAALVADDLVVFENGERNDGWTDFRDHHLVPEMQEPAPVSKWELVRCKANGDQAWGYTHETFTSARGTPLVVWSVFVLEKRAAAWKIVMLDWSVGRAK